MAADVAIYTNTCTLAAMEAYVERVVEVVRAMDDPPDLESLRALVAVRDLIDARTAKAARRLEQDGAPSADGAVNMAHWLRTRAGRSDREARQIMRRSARLTGCPALSAAWHAGELSTAQVDAVVAAVSDRTVGFLRQQDEPLAAALSGLSARQSALVIRHWRAYADALVDGAEPTCSVRAVYLSPGFDGGGELSGRLDPGAYEVVDAALAAATTADNEGEPARTMAQRRADALVTISQFFLDHGDRASSRRHRPHVHVTMTVEELERRAAGRSLDGGFVDAASMGALLCDAGIHRVVTDGASVVLDVGRTTRTISHHLFGALAVRDGGCRFPGCDRPVSWCEVHHVVPWASGGATAPSNTILLCWRHHHDLAHQRAWQLKLLPDATVEVTKPDGTLSTSRPPPPAMPTIAGLDAA